MDVQITNFLSIVRYAINGGKSPQLQQPDINKLYGLAKEHSLLPIFYEGLAKLDPPPPEQIKSRLKLESAMIISVQAQRTEVFLEIYKKLEEGGIRPIVMKGIVCRGTYGDLADHRPSGDEDMYIRPEELTKCKSILEENGYEMEKLNLNDELIENVQEVTFYGEINLEVHINPMGSVSTLHKKMNKLFERAFDDGRIDETSGQPIYTFNHTEHFLFLFFHLYKHMIGSGVGLRQVIDLMMYKRAYCEEIDWTRVEEALKQFSAEQLFSDIEHIGNTYFGFDFEPKLPPKCPERLIEDMIESGAFGHASREHAASAVITLSALNGDSNVSPGFFSALFPSVSVLQEGYPVLLRHKWMLPFVWIYRLFKFIIRKVMGKNSLGLERVNIGKKRLELLKEYELF